MGVVGLGGLNSALAAAPTITITIDKNFGAEIKVANTCTAPWDEKIKFPTYLKPDAHDDNLDGVISGFIECREGKAKIDVVLKGETYYPFAVLPREYQWSGLGAPWVEYALSRLGVPTSCSAAEDGKAPTKDENSCKAIFMAAGYSFTLPKPFDHGEIISDYGSNKKIHFPVYPCQFDIRGPLPGIVAGAAEQLVYLQLSDKTPNCRLPERTASLTTEDGKSVGLAEIQNLTRAQQGLKLTGISESLKEGAQTLKLVISGGPAAEVRAHVLPRVIVDKLVVKYNVPANLDTYGHFAAASGDAAKDESGKFIAVVSPKIELPSGEKNAVVNTAHLSWPTALVSASSSIREQYECTANYLKIVVHRNSIEGKITSLKQKRSTLATLRPNLAQVIAAIAAPTAPKKDPPPALLVQRDGLQAQINVLEGEIRALESEIGKLEWELGDFIRKESSYFVWNVQNNNSKSFQITKPMAPADGTSAEDWRYLSFVANDAMPDAPMVTLQLEQTIKFANDEKVHTFKVLKLDVPLAAKARVESLPLPARDMLEVVCNGEKVAFWNSEVHAIRETAMPEGECRVQLKPKDAQVADKDRAEWQQLHDLLTLYGPQTFSVIVRRGGVEDKQLWQFSPTARDGRCNCPGFEVKAVRQPFWAQSITLGEPKSDTKTDAYYTVEIRPIARQDIAVAYRKSSLQKIDETDVKIAGELTFTTRLRSRGTFAFPIAPRLEARRVEGEYKKPVAVRTYLSLSVIASALRFPASQTDRRTSQSSTSVQYVSPVVGALWSWELWDYDRGVNRLPLNLTAQAGGHFYKAGPGDITFNPIGGIAMTLPIVQEETPAGSQLGTKATLGFYGEIDTRDCTPHFMIAVGANIGSLLSGK